MPCNLKNKVDEIVYSLKSDARKAVDAAQTTKDNLYSIYREKLYLDDLPAQLEEAYTATEDLADTHIGDISNQLDDLELAVEELIDDKDEKINELKEEIEELKKEIKDLLSE